MTIMGKPNSAIRLLVAAAALIPTLAAGEGKEFRRLGIVNYAETTPAVASWIDKTFSYKIGGGRPSSPQVKWAGYFDVYGLGSLPEYLKMKDFARRNGFDHEQMLLHAARNYKSGIPNAFKEMDRFDAFEGKNGVLKSDDDRRFEDLTAKAYRGEVKLEDTVYIGYEEPFSDINMEFAKPGKKVESAFQYWNGSIWSSLEVSDGTEGFARDGLIRFAPPAEWQETSINGSRRKYFVRLVVADAKRHPVSKRIYGDSWMKGGEKDYQGWDWSSHSIKRAGKIIYNPAPPKHASARFPYQARVPFWGGEHFIANPGDFQRHGDGTARTWALFSAQRIVDIVKSAGYQGIMCDDGSRDVAWDGIPAAETDFKRKSAKSWFDESADKFRDMVKYVKEADAKILVGVNAQEKKLVKHGDWHLAEYHTGVWRSGPGAIGSDENPKAMSYDDLLPELNPEGREGVLMYQDTADIVPEKGVPWDRANRGPMVALSKHYIGANEHSVFSYYSRGGYIYDETDQVVLKNGKVLRLSADEVPPLDKVARWATFFPAMAVDIGLPDPKGHNGGKRDMHWKRGNEIGGGPDIWRRDYTKGVVLHRPAYWETPAALYETCSENIPLGGAYYPLRADGTTGSAVNTICLRAGEGALLLKTGDGQ